MYVYHTYKHECIVLVYSCDGVEHTSLLCPTKQPFKLSYNAGAVLVAVPSGYSCDKAIWRTPRKGHSDKFINVHKATRPKDQIRDYFGVLRVKRLQREVPGPLCKDGGTHTP